MLTRPLLLDVYTSRGKKESRERQLSPELQGKELDQKIHEASFDWLLLTGFAASILIFGMISCFKF